MNVNLVASDAPRSTAGSPPSATDAAAGKDSFARWLDREQAGPSGTAQEGTASEPPQASDRQAAQRSARSATKPAGRAPEKAAARAPGEARTEAGEHDADRTDRAAVADGAGDPTLLHWLQGLSRQPAATDAAAPGGDPGGRAMPSAAAPDSADKATGGLPTATASAPSASAPGRDAGRAAATAAEAIDTAADRQAIERERATAPAQAGAEAASARSDTPALPRFADVLGVARGAAPEALAAPGAAPAAPAAPADVPPPTAASVTVPIDDPQFPRAFGVQVSVLARDGVQRAELHLNPAEMGPVSVQIVLDGTHARIDFGADAAPTRALIEHGLPDLAAALREAGLTLAGGGVSQHAGQGRDPSGQPAQMQRPEAGAASAEPTAALRPLRRHVTAGGVDLYA